jgi:protein involved in polysaccharide export with SLBB domain
MAATTGDPAKRAQSAAIAAAIHQRLRDGDLQVGDRVVVTIISDAVHRDTVVVRSERSLELPGMIVVSVAGVLRSELQQRVSTEVLKYVKAQQIEVTPLIRVGVMGAVARPGYFAFASDIPITDAIMGAGGPTGTADVGRSIVRRQNQEFRSAGETSKAISTGLTLDQFGLSAGDELVVGQRRELAPSTLIGMTGALASILALFVTLNRH